MILKNSNPEEIMVKIERKDNEKSQQAIVSLAKEKKKSSGKCNTNEVVIALQEMFHNKCYICENKNATEWEVEHLIPPAGNLDLKFEWKNLFWSCGHCNHIKGNKFTPILDCTKVDVDEIISFRKIGYFGIDEFLNFEKVDSVEDNEQIQMTCALLKRVYYGETLQEKSSAKILRHEVQAELSQFKNYIREYIEAAGEDKKDLFVAICNQRKSNSKFAAFKRWIVRDNSNCKDFIDCWKK